MNDVSGLLHDPALGRVAADAGVPIVLMHTRGRSREMYDLAVYQDVVAEVSAELRQAMNRAVGAGVSREAIVLDPGFGFAKRAEHSVELLAKLDPEVAATNRRLLGHLSQGKLRSLIDLLGEARNPA